MKKLLPVLIIIFSLAGIAASFILTIDKIEILKDPNYGLSCGVNTVIDCSHVINSDQAEVFGFPNTILGLIGYSIFFTFGVSMFYSDIKKKWPFLLANIGALIAAIFSHWLLYESAYELDGLCPYCLLSWFSTTNLFFISTYICLVKGYYPKTKEITDKNLKSNINSIFISAVILWYAIIFGLVYNQFGNELFS